MKAAYMQRGVKCMSLICRFSDHRYLYILLTRTPDLPSRLIAMLTGCHYTHASIGLEEDPNTFYSFVRSGFRVETITRYLRPEWEPFDCVLYRLAVDEQTYRKARRLLAGYAARKPQLRYTCVGVLLCLLGIGLRWRNHYFCSQFVAEVLTRVRAVALPWRSELCLPRNLQQMGFPVQFQGNLQDMLSAFGIYGAPAAQ